MRATLILAASAGLLSCTDSPTTSVVPVNSVEFTTTGSSIRAGSTLILGVRLSDADGNAVNNVAVYWSSSDVSVATVSSAGVVSAMAPGQVTIAASALGKSATTKITVTDREVATVQVSPAVASVRIGTTTPLTATAFDADGKVLTRSVTWSSSDPSVLTVSANGVVTGVATGAATVTATSEGRSATAAITVTLSPVATVTITPARDTLGVSAQISLTATLKDAAGAVLTGRTVTWGSTNVQIATVSSTGIVTALAPGTVTISASSEGRTGAATVVVLARLASSVTLTPSAATAVAGATLQLSSQVTDPSGNLLNDRPISFTSDNNLVALVSTTGLVTAVSPGTVRITASSEGKTGTATVVVTSVPVAAINVTPAISNLFVGSTLQLNAQALAAGGAVLSGRTTTWLSGAPGIATVSSTGLVTAVAPGTAVIVAVVDGVSGAATTTVLAHPVGSVGVTPQYPSIPVGATEQLTATVRDDTGNVLTGRAVIWKSADESVAFVSSSGLVVALKVGSTMITATVEGISGFTPFTVK